MISKLKSKKGISLVEILVSLAIASLLLIPISSMVNTAIKTNKKSETRQQATLLGQQILEELELLPQIKKDKIDLSGGSIDGDIKNNSAYAVYETNKYKKENNTYAVKIEIEENKDIKYTQSSNSQDEDISDIKDKINLKSYENSGNIEIDKDGYKQSILIDDYQNIKINIEFIEENGLKKVKVSDGNSVETYSLKEDKLILNFTQDYNLNQGINIEVINSMKEATELYIQKSYECEERIYIDKVFGNINIYNIRDSAETEEMQMNNMYNIKVNISKDDKVLFNGSGNKNIKIND